METVGLDYGSYHLSVLQAPAQVVELRFSYDAAVVFTQGAPNVRLTIYGATFNTDVTADGNDFVVRTNITGSPYNTILNGLLTFDSEMTGVEIGGAPATKISSEGTSGYQYFPKTVVPIGTEFTSDSQGSDEVTVDISGVPHTNGMTHVGIYHMNSDKKLVPIWSDTADDTDPIQVFTYVSFLDNYNPPTIPTGYTIAKAIANDINAERYFDTTRYSISFDGDSVAGTGSVTVKDKSETPGLYVLVFDDELIQAIHSKDSTFDYPSLLAHGDGVLPLYPYQPVV